MVGTCGASVIAQYRSVTERRNCASNREVWFKGNGPNKKKQQQTEQKRASPTRAKLR
eukprot:IDg17550t1